MTVRSIKVPLGMLTHVQRYRLEGFFMLSRYRDAISMAITLLRLRGSSDPYVVKRMADWTRETVTLLTGVHPQPLDFAQVPPAELLTAILAGSGQKVDDVGSAMISSLLEAEVRETGPALVSDKLQEWLAQRWLPPNGNSKEI